MIYALKTIDGTIIRYQEFTESPPVLSATKGLVWVQEDPPVIPQPVLPLIVSPRQIRQALTAAGTRTAVEAGVAAADQDTRDWWEFATSFEEDHPMISTMASALGITDTQRHDIFVLAASL